MKIEDFNKLVFACFGILLFGIILPMLIGSLFEYFLPGSHFQELLPIMVISQAIIIAKKKKKKDIPGPGDETPWDNDNNQDGGKI